jgi:hypothetical protein
MLKMKNAALTMAVILALAACGGGSSDPVDPGTNTPTNPGTDPGTDTGTDPGTDPADDATFEGNMVLAANQVLFNYPAPNEVAVDYETFQTSGAFGFARGENAPIESFGLRVYQEGMMGQSENVRVALELDDVDSDGLIQVLLDQATLSIDDAGVMSATVPDTARVHVVVRNAAGESASVSADGVAPGAFSFIGNVDPDDTNSHGLVIDLDALMAAAIAAASAENQALLQSARDVEGQFNMRVGITGVTLRNQAATDLTLAEPITVGDQPAVSTGAGLSGVLYIGVTP